MKYVQKILQTVFPIECVQCELTGSYVCEGCLRSLRFFDNASCFVCNGQGYAGKVCAPCREEVQYDHLWIAVPYDQQIVRTLIWQCKYQYVEEMAQALGDVMLKGMNQSHLVELLLLQDAVVVPMPAHRRRLRQRGFNQAALIAQHLAAHIPGWRCEELVERIRNTRSQLAYAKDERALNVQGAFALRPESVIPHTVVIVDDVVTTGSSLNEVARVLREAGVRRVIGVVAARRL